MLTIHQVDNVVQNNLFTMKGWEHERQQQGATILYTVWINATSPKLYLGVFRVWEGDDGSGRCDWQPLTKITSEQKRLREFFYLEMVMPILVKANKTSDNQKAVQSFEDKDRTVTEAIKYYKEVIENNQDETLSDKEKQSYFYRLQKHIYKLGNGNWEKGSARFDELQKENHEQERKKNPALTRLEEMSKSKNPVDKMFVKFLIEGGFELPAKDAEELQRKLLQKEIYELAKQLPAQPAETNIVRRTFNAISSEYTLPPNVSPMDEKPKQKGRYRLTPKEIKKRKEIVKKANKMKKENPLMLWKQIAVELDIPERTLRDYRHQYYK